RGRLTHDRARVRREREHPVDRAFGIGGAHTPLQGGERTGGLGLGLLEIARREGHQRRHGPPPGTRRVTRRRDDRLVVVVADGVVVLAMAEVHRQVLVPQDRVRHLAGLTLELGDRIGPDQLVLDRDQRDRDAGECADRRAPDPGAEQDALALDIAPVRPNTGHAPPPPPPRSARTPATPPSRTSNPVTATPPSNAAPFASAPRASAVAILT